MSTEQSPFPDGDVTHFTGVIMKNGGIVDIMTYGSEQEVLDNMRDSSFFDRCDHAAIHKMDINGNSRVVRELK